MAENEVYDLAVVGGGPAGLATAMYAGMRGLEVVVFEAQDFGGQLINLYPSKPVTNFPAQSELESRELAAKLSAQARDFGAELAEWEAVLHVWRREDVFVLDTERRVVEGRALVLALGLGRFMPRRLGLAAEDIYLGRGLTYRLPPVEEIDARHVVVVGGGDTAVDTALALQRLAQVTLVVRRGEMRAHRHSVDQLEHSDVAVLTNAEVVELRGAGRLESALVSREDSDSVELAADLLLVSIGQVPDVRGVASWEVGVEGPRVQVDTSMSTGRPGVYAVGDFADYEGKVKMIATAVAEGSTAAASVERFLMGGGLTRAA